MRLVNDGYAVGVDFGTSNTVALVRWPDGRTRPVLFDGQPVLASAVYLDGWGAMHVGRDAQRMAQVDPSRYEPNPKRRVDEGRVLLGDREVLVTDLLAAPLARVARAVREAVGHLPRAVLACPVAWGQTRRAVLLDAAARAGWQGTELVYEPVAAARYLTATLGRPIPPGGVLAVFDFGGGTLDVALVRNDGGTLAVIGKGGSESLGGVDFDAALVGHLGGLLAQRHPAIWAQITQPADALARRHRQAFWDDVRAAKEMLSRAAVAPVPIPGVDAALHLTRDELERVAEPLVRHAVAELQTTLDRSGLARQALSGVFLVGGASRMPLVSRLLHAHLGVPPTVPDQPELPVAEGALPGRRRIRPRDDRLLGHEPGRRGDDRVVVFRDRDQLVARLDPPVARRVEDDLPAGEPHPDDRRRAEGVQRVPVRGAGERGLLVEVDLVATEVEQVGVDDGQPRLEAGLHDEPRRHVGRVDQVGVRTAGQPRRGQVLGVGHRADDVAPPGLALAGLRDREQGLDELGVAVAVGGREDDDRPGGLRADDGDVVRVHRVAGAAHHPRVAGAARLRPDLVLHLDLVAVGEDHDARAALVAVGLDQLPDDGEHLVGPAEQHGVVAFEHRRPALAQLAELGVEPGGEHADERGDHEDPADRDGETDRHEPPVTAVAGHRARVEGVQDALPHRLRQAPLVVTLRRHRVQQPDQRPSNEDDRQ